MVNLSPRSSVWRENVLNNLDTYTYNWAIHIVHPSDANLFEEVLDTGRYVTIAESGVENEISIQDVEQELTLLFVQENRQSAGNRFRINLIEPGGATLFNRILYASRQLGIENHLKACYLLELKFKGWQDGAPVEQIDGAGPFYYSCTMVDLAFTFKEGASIYSAQLVETTLEAYNRMSLHLHQDANIVAGTLGEFLEQLTEEVNEQEEFQKRNSPLGVLPDIYELNTISEWEGFTFEAVESESNSGLSVENSGGKLKFNFPIGTALNTAVAMAVLHTAEFKRILTETGFAKDNSSDIQANARQLASLPQWFKIDTEVEYGAYDFIAKQYSKTYRYTIGSYITPELIHDPASLIELLNSSNLQRDRLRNIFENGLLQKRYDYYFTGLNTEIIDINLELRNMYFQLFPQNAGSVRFREQFFNGNGGEVQQQINALRSTRDELEAQVSSLQQEREELRQTVREFSGFGGAEPPARQAEERIARVQQELSNKQRQLFRATEEFETRYAGLVEEARAAAANNRSIGRLQNNYITQSELSTLSTEEILPVSFEYGVVESLATLGADKEEGSVGAVLLGAVELNLNSLADLVNLDLAVRGDPYWLGQPRGAGSAGAPYDIGGTSLYLELNFPTYPDESTGFISNLGDYSISGVYRVYSITASYSQGRFDMRLGTFRDVVTNNQELQDYLDQGFVESNAIAEPAPTSQLEQNETDNDSATTETTPRGNDSGAANDPSAVGSDSPGGHNFDNRVNADLRTLLAQSADATGVTLDTTSGYRGPGGSGRHNRFASDIALRSNGRILTVANSEDRAVIENFTREFRDRARSQGYTPSVGWADHTEPRSNWYMSGNVGHYDIALDRFIPRVAPDGSVRSTYWGNGERQNRAPTWLRDIMR